MPPTSDPGWHAVDAAYAAVKAFSPRDQATETTWAIVAVLSALREKSKDVYEARTAFNRACDETLADLQQRLRPSGSRRRAEPVRSERGFLY